eukprot:gene8323-17132_t
MQFKVHDFWMGAKLTILSPIRFDSGVFTGLCNRKSGLEDLRVELESRLSAIIHNSTDTILSKISKISTRKDIKKVLEAIEKHGSPTSIDATEDFHHSRTLDKIEESKDNFVAALHTLEDKVQLSEDEVEHAMVETKEQIVTSLNSHMENIKADIVRDGSRTEERLLAQMKDHEEEVLASLGRMQSQVASDLESIRQQMVTLINGSKDELVNSQEKLIEKYTTRIIAQVVFIFGFAVGLITEYDFYKEKLNAMLRFLMNRKIDNKKMFFIF